MRRAREPAGLTGTVEEVKLVPSLAVPALAREWDLRCLATLGRLTRRWQMSQDTVSPTLHLRLRLAAALLEASINCNVIQYEYLVHY